MMKFLHIMYGSLRLLWRFRFRSALTLFSAMLGVTGVISAVNYASGGREQVLNQIQRLGTNIIIVTPQQSRSVGGRARTGEIVTTLIEEDYTAIRREVSSISRFSAIVSLGVLLKVGEFSKNSRVIGCQPDYPKIRNWQIVEGEFFGIAEERRSGRVAVLGHTVARDLFSEGSPIGQRLFINRVPFEVIGVLAEYGQGIDNADEDNQVYVPLPTAMHRLMNIDYYSALIFAVSHWQQMDETAKQITAILRQRHHTLAKQPEDFQVQNQKQLIDIQIAASERLNFFVYLIGLCGLFVAGLGILAISWIGVKARTVEIGTRRALGATSFDIFFQIFFEAIVVAVLGSMLGLAAGWQSSHLIAKQVNLPFVFDWQNAWITLTIAIVLNLIFALFPSQKAARLHPIHALKYE
ncbi:MAG: ABC transporter permease [Acidobacteriota bacterium]